jgi:transposase
MIMFSPYTLSLLNNGIFFKFQGITELFIQEEGEIVAEVLNIEEFHWKVLGLLGEEYENICL